MNGKKWCVSFLLIYGILIFSIISFVVVLDPYFHYHEPIKGLSYSDDKGIMSMMEFQKISLMMQ